MRFIIGWLILLPFAGAWWLTIKIVDACIKRSNALRPFGILISLIVGGGSLVAGYSIGSIVGWFIMACGALFIVVGIWRSLATTKGEVQLEEWTDKRVREAELRRGGRELSFLEKEELKKRGQQLFYYEKRVRENMEDSLALSALVSLYQLEKRYKDMENTLRRCIEVNNRVAKPDFWDCRNLGGLYLAALSNSVRKKQIPIRGYYHISDITVDSLGYNLEETKNLAMEYFEKAHELSEKAISDGKHNYLINHQKEVKLGYTAAKELSDRAFVEYDKYLDKMKVEDEEETRKRRGEITAEQGE